MVLAGELVQEQVLQEQILQVLAQGTVSLQAVQRVVLLQEFLLVQLQHLALVACPLVVLERVFGRPC